MSSFVFCFYAAGYLFIFSEALRIDGHVILHFQVIIIEHLFAYRDLLSEDIVVDINVFALGI